MLDGLIAGYGRQLRWVLDASAGDAAGRAGDAGADGRAVHVGAEGLLPGAGHRRHPGRSPKRRSRSRSRRWPSGSRPRRGSSWTSRTSRGLSSFIGVDGNNATLNSGRMLVTLDAARPSDAHRGRGHRDSCARACQQVPGITLYLQPVQDLTIEDRVSRTQFQFILEDPDVDRLSLWVPRLIDRLKQSRDLQRCRQRPAGPRPAGLPEHRSRCRQPPGRQRLGHRRCPVRRVRSAPDLDHLHAGQPVSRRARSGAALSDRPRVAAADPRGDRHAQGGTAASRQRLDQQQIPLSSIATVEQRYTRLVINHAGQFPAVTLSFNLGPGASLGAAVAAIESGAAGDRNAGQHSDAVSGRGRSVPLPRSTARCC